MNGYVVVVTGLGIVWRGVDRAQCESIAREEAADTARIVELQRVEAGRYGAVVLRIEPRRY